MVPPTHHQPHAQPTDAHRPAALPAAIAQRIVTEVWSNLGPRQGSSRTAMWFFMGQMIVHTHYRIYPGVLRALLHETPDIRSHRWNVQPDNALQSKPRSNQPRPH